MFENKNEYHLNCNEIADLINLDTGNNFNESTYRKKFADFNRGRLYERKMMSNGIVSNILTISDLHVPYHLPVETYHDYVGKIDILQINGDVGDCQAISKFPKIYRVSPMEELILTRQHLIEIIDYLHPKKVVINYGNHDLRFQNYFAKNLDSDLLELMPKTSLELICVDGFHHYDKRNRTKVWYKALQKVYDDIEIEYIDNWFCQIGETIFCHPLAFKGGNLKTAEDAMIYFRNEGYQFTSLVMAHTHRVGGLKIGNTVLYEQGCCCDVKKANYNDGKLIKSQKEGFLFLGQDKTGKVIKDKQEYLN